MTQDAAGVAAIAIGPSQRLTAQALEVARTAGWATAGPFLSAEDLLAYVSQRADVSVALVGSRLAGFGRHIVEDLFAHGILTYVITSDAAPLADSGSFGQLMRVVNITDLAPALGDFDGLDREIAVPDLPATGPGRSRAPASLIAVTSGKGSVGKTTVAMALAWALGRILGPDQVTLCDFDLRGGSLGAWLDVNTSQGLFTATTDHENSPQLAAEQYEQLEWFRVLAGLDLPATSYPLDGFAAQAVVDALLQLSAGGVVIVDTESEAHPDWILDRASAAVVVAEPDFMGVVKAHGVAQRLLAVRPNRIALALNPSRSGSSPGTEVREALGMGRQVSPTGIAREAAPTVEIPYRRDDPDAMRAARPAGLGDTVSERAFTALARTTLELLPARYATTFGGAPAAVATSPAGAAATPTSLFARTIARLRPAAPSLDGAYLERAAGESGPDDDRPDDDRPDDDRPDDDLRALTDWAPAEQPVPREDAADAAQDGADAPAEPADEDSALLPGTPDEDTAGGDDLAAAAAAPVAHPAAHTAALAPTRWFARTLARLRPAPTPPAPSLDDTNWELGLGPDAGAADGDDPRALTDWAPAAPAGADAGDAAQDGAPAEPADDDSAGMPPGTPDDDTAGSDDLAAAAPAPTSWFARTLARLRPAPTPAAPSLDDTNWELDLGPDAGAADGDDPRALTDWAPAEPAGADAGDAAQDGAPAEPADEDAGDAAQDGADAPAEPAGEDAGDAAQDGAPAEPADDDSAGMPPGTPDDDTAGSDDLAAAAPAPTSWFARTLARLRPAPTPAAPSLDDTNWELDLGPDAGAADGVDGDDPRALTDWASAARSTPGAAGAPDAEAAAPDVTAQSAQKDDA